VALSHAFLLALQWEVAMLAEIFLLRLEFMLRQGAVKRAVSNRARFVPIRLPVSFRAVPGRA
jgi:hypothetical protein